MRQEFETKLTDSSKSDEVYHVLVERIRTEVWPVDLIIPTELELAAEFECGRSVIGKALVRLVHEGLVERKKRAGTRVISNSSERGSTKVDLDAFAFIYPSEQHEGIRRIGQGFQQASHESGRRMVTLTTGTNFRKEAEIIGRLSEFDLKGVVVYPVLPEPKDRLYFAQMLLSCPSPVVLTDISLPGFGAPAVVIDGHHAGYTMTRHLLKQGLRKIGFLSNYAWVPSFKDRYLGYRRALEEAGVEEELGAVLMSPNLKPDFQHPVEKSGCFTRTYLENAPGLEGVVCSEDFLALSCLSSAQDLGLRVPEDLKIVGISDYEVSTQSDPSLTTYHVPYEEIGRQAFQILNRLVQGETLSTTEVAVRGSIVVRKSG